MFSYRHAFHAGNHADVLKHITLMALLDYLTRKDTALTVIDTHAGAGLYRLDGDHSQTSGEAGEGILRLAQALRENPGELALPIRRYRDLLASLNPAFAKSGDPNGLRVYPGSPYIAAQFMQGRHKLKLFELHPTDFRALSGHIEQLELGRSVSCALQDGFEALRPLLPPPSRRALVFCDPSYEMKTDYARVHACLAEAIKRFPTGCYALWYPIIPRPEAHELPKKLRTLANRAGRPWLDATLTVKGSKLHTTTEGEVIRPGLPASGMFVINPPYTLHDELKTALPLLWWTGWDKIETRALAWRAAIDIQPGLARVGLRRIGRQRQRPPQAKAQTSRPIARAAARGCPDAGGCCRAVRQLIVGHLNGTAGDP